MNISKQLGEMADRLELDIKTPTYLVVKSVTMSKVLKDSDLKDIYAYRTGGLRKDQGFWLKSKVISFINATYMISVFRDGDKIVFNKGNWYFSIPYTVETFKYLLDNQA